MGRPLRLLLDTHALIWWWGSDEKLPQVMVDRLLDPVNEILVSAVSAWEIATKRRLGKLPELGSGFDFLAFADQQDLGFLAISVQHAERGGAYPAAHGDPFDRLLAAQSELESIPLLTRDPAFAAFPCETRW